YRPKVLQLLMVDQPDQKDETPALSDKAAPHEEPDCVGRAGRLRIAYDRKAPVHVVPTHIAQDVGIAVALIPYVSFDAALPGRKCHRLGRLGAARAKSQQDQREA